MLGYVNAAIIQVTPYLLTAVEFERMLLMDCLNIFGNNKTGVCHSQKKQIIGQENRSCNGK